MMQLTLATPSKGNHGLPQGHLNDFNLKLINNHSLLRLKLIRRPEYEIFEAPAWHCIFFGDGLKRLCAASPHYSTWRVPIW
jgi:hypothetical protein